MVTTAAAAESVNIRCGEENQPAEPGLGSGVMPQLCRSQLGENGGMNVLRRAGAWWLAAWITLSVAGAWLIAQTELSRLRDAFETDARIAHRLLSQRAVELDAVLATLALLQTGAEANPPERRLPSVYPQILTVQRRDPEARWPQTDLENAEAMSRSRGQPALALPDFSAGRYTLVLAAHPASFALLIDMNRLVPWSEWPADPLKSPARVALEKGSQAFVIQTGAVGRGSWQFDFRKRLATDSQPFDVVAKRQVAWSQLPWLAMAAWALLAGAALAGVAALVRQREQRRRAEELLRLGQVARLNTLGELAGGMAHELNQPLTAVLANTQAAQRLLEEETPDLPTVRGALAQAAGQARRAADVVGRLRSLVEQPNTTAHTQAVALHDAVRKVLHLLQPELARHQVELSLAADTPVWVMAEPIALDQILHNLLLNALQALEQVPASQRRLDLAVVTSAPSGVLTIADSGPGIRPEALPHVFEPFYSTRKGGLGLGLSLCETLAANMGGTLTVANQARRGAVFTLILPACARP